MARIGKKTHLAGPTTPGYFHPTPEQKAAMEKRIQERGIDITLRGWQEREDTPETEKNEPEDSRAETEQD